MHPERRAFQRFRNARRRLRPETLLGVLGLSQAVYIAGKVVTPSSMADLNNGLDDLRESEKQFRNAAVAASATASLQAAIGAVG
jgi:hypothetical protein